ncbi:TRAP transporter small permease [Oscillibacter sp.]|uniref:TRAP transporter small permease n=1 Tax=Oscillibacter sp. TaxID=1945593 RepID=UPI002897891B|nr:TRAP transporter small permease [Oscillibacter sp.]
MLTYYTRFLDGVQRVIKVLEIILLAAITLIMVYQCMMRYIFQNAQPWCEELALYLSIYSIFLGIPIAVRRDSHLQVDFLLAFMSKKFRYLISAISSVAAIVFMLVFCYYGLSLIQHATSASTTLPLKMRDIYYSFPVGAVLVILFSVEAAVRNFLNFLGKSPADSGKESV